MAGNFVQKALVVVAGAYIAFATFVFVSEGGLGVLKPRPARSAALFPAISATLPRAEDSLVVIPRLGVSATMQSIGLTPYGDIGIPTNYTDVAWFTGSVQPGVFGTSIVVGHRDTRVFTPGVFRYLSELQAGDDIYTYQKGTRSHFRVVSKKVYTEDADMEEILSSDGATARLNLITCEGTWNQLVKRYNERLVVFTELVT